MLIGMRKKEPIGLVCGIIVLMLAAPSSSAKNRPAHPYRYSLIDLPISLGEGSVTIPQIVPRKSGWHWIMVQVEKPLPFEQMICMMGVTHGPLEAKNCSAQDPLLRAEWTVREADRIVSSGSNTASADAAFTETNIFKFLGKFPAETGKSYVVEVRFTKDGTPLNIANPHLIVTRVGEE